MMNNESNLPPLPHPTVQYIAASYDEIDEATIGGIICNPVYVGVPPYRRIVSDETWVRAAAELIKEHGVEQFLVNMLYVLRTSMVDAVPDEAIPDDYDGPWPYEDDDDDDDDWDDFEEGLSPWYHPLEGHIFCSHDALPMIILDDDFVCVSEYLMAHIDSSPVTDLITEPSLSLVFQNGHTLPILCPDCGSSLHITDHNELLDEINGLMIVEVEWLEDTEELILEFGKPGNDENEAEKAPYLAVHLDSVRQLTCPHRNIWDDDLED